MSRPRCKHTNLTPNCLSCTKVKEKWEKKLEESGMNNIEQADGNLKRWSNLYVYTRNNMNKYLSDPKSRHFISQKYSTDNVQQAAKDHIEQKVDYYRFAGQFLHSYKFESNKDELVWTYHSDGRSVREINILLKKEHRVNLTQSKINAIVARLKAQMLEELKNGL